MGWLGLWEKAYSAKEVSFLLKITEPKKVLCIHDLSGVGRCSLAVILPVLSVMGIQPVASGHRPVWTAAPTARPHWNITGRWG